MASSAAISSFSSRCALVSANFGLAETTGGLLGSVPGFAPGFGQVQGGCSAGLTSWARASSEKSPSARHAGNRAGQPTTQRRAGKHTIEPTHGTTPRRCETPVHECGRAGLKWRERACRATPGQLDEDAWQTSRKATTTRGRRPAISPQAGEPFALFEAWFAEAQAHEPNDPNAMALASVDASGMPNVRMVLLKGVDAADHPARGFVFYTNLESAKGVELLASRKAALCFHWKSLRRQVRVRGDVSRTSRRRGRCLFRHARPRQPARRLGLAAVAPLGEPLRAREGRRRRDGQIPHRRHPPPAPLVGLPHHAGRDGILARPPLPPARARRLPARGAERAVGQAAAVSLTSCGVRRSVEAPRTAAMLRKRTERRRRSAAGDRKRTCRSRAGR